MADAGSQWVLMLIMSHYLTVSSTALLRVIDGGSICVWTSELNQLWFPRFMVGDLGILRNVSGCHT